MYLKGISISQDLQKIANDSYSGSFVIEEKVLRVLMHFFKNDSEKNLHSSLKKIMNFIKDERENLQPRAGG